MVHARADAPPLEQFWEQAPTVDYNNVPRVLTSVTRSYYGADDRLRVVNKRVTLNPANTTPVIGYSFTATGGILDAVGLAAAGPDALESLEEYRYDALGRRVLKRSRRTSCEPVCLSTLERYVWDGDNLLEETRYPGHDGISNDSLEVHAGLVSWVSG